MNMRKVSIRWNINSLHGSDEISQILSLVHSIEILGHLSVTNRGITQLSEIKLRQNTSLEDISKLKYFQVIDKYEEDEDGILVSLLCTHPLAIMGIEMANIHLQTPYKLCSEMGMELRISGIARYNDNFTPPEYDFVSDEQTLGLWHFDDLSGNMLSDDSGFIRPL